MRSEVISTAPSGCTQGEQRGGQKRSVALDSERGSRREAVLLVLRKCWGKMALKLLH